jgi:predicted amidohydrolase
MGKFKAAAVQMRSGREPERNVVDFEALVREAAAKGATYVQTPEMTGAIIRDKADRAMAFRQEKDDVIVAAAGRLSAELGIFLHVGSTGILRQDGKIANRAFLFAPDGSLAARYDKIHMFDVDLDNGESWRESATYEPGREAVVTDIGVAKLGFGICYDVRFPQLFRAEALAGAEVLTAPAAFTRQTGQAHWHILQRARAIESGAFMISAAQGGQHEDGRETFGHSVIVDPWGRILAEADHDEPCVIVAEIDTALSAEARQKIPNLKNAREFGVASVAAAPVALRGAAS